jgi:hypothetical protein
VQQVNLQQPHNRNQVVHDYSSCERNPVFFVKSVIVILSDGKTGFLRSLRNQISPPWETKYQTLKTQINLVSDANKLTCNNLISTKNQVVHDFSSCERNPVFFVKLRIVILSDGKTGFLRSLRNRDLRNQVVHDFSSCERNPVFLVKLRIIMLSDGKTEFLNLR